MRDAAQERVARQNNGRLTGAEIFAKCESEGIRAKFNVDNECVGYYCRYSGKSVSSSLPINFTIEMFEDYDRARIGASPKKSIASSFPKQNNQPINKEEPMPTATAAKPKKNKKPEEEKLRRGRPSNLDPDKKIKILVDENPKRDGTTAHKVFELYKEGMTVSEFLALKGAGSEHLNWDIKKGFVKLV